MALPKKSRKSEIPSSLVHEMFTELGSKMDGIQSQIANIDKRLDLSIQRNEFEFKALNELDIKQNEILKEHHDRSVQLKRDNDLREVSVRNELEATKKATEKELQAISGRVEALEAPRKWWKQTRVKAMAWGTAIACILEIVRYALDLLHK